MQARFHQVGWQILDVLFPPTCVGCGAACERFCSACYQSVRLISKPFCQFCGHPLPHARGTVCNRCQTTRLPCTMIRSWAVLVDPIQAAIHRLKYHQDRGLGEALAKPLIEMLVRHTWMVDLVLPVPLDKQRKKERGYNQSALLAKPVAWRTGVPYSCRALLKTRITSPQVGLSYREREQNLSGAFRASRKEVYLKRIVVIDDVITTGATIKACAAALLAAGASQVYGLSLARSLATKPDWC